MNNQQLPVSVSSVKSVSKLPSRSKILDTEDTEMRMTRMKANRKRGLDFPPAA